MGVETPRSGKADESMRITWQRIMSVILSIFLSFTVACSVDHSIDREIARIKLGMTQAEVGKVFRMTEQEDPFVSSAKKYGENVEEQKEIVSVAGRQTFALEGSMPPGASSIRAVFTNGRLSEITLHFPQKYVARTSWEVFVHHAVEKYGRPVEAVFSWGWDYNWSDAHTTLHILRVKGSKNGEHDDRFYELRVLDAHSVEEVRTIATQVKGGKHPSELFGAMETRIDRISDVLRYLRHVYYVPGDSLIHWLLARGSRIAQFLEIRTGDYGGLLSGLISLAAWLIVGSWGVAALLYTIVTFLMFVDWMRKRSNKGAG